MAENSLEGTRIVLGVSGSIAAYKAADIASQLVGLGADVKVVMTPNAAKFITPITMRALTGESPLADTFHETREGQVAHISILDKASLLLIAPATADVIGKIAHGIADDILTTLTMAAKCPVMIAPAMNTNMWTNPIVISNVDRLKTFGYSFIDPEEGRLACGMVGLGKLASVDTIVQAVVNSLCGDAPLDWEGIRLLVTAGPTREPIDPVRYLSNYSSGHMGYAIAETAQSRGADVTLVTGPSDMPVPNVARVVNVETASEMLSAVRDAFPQCKVVISAAAVSDFSPRREDRKIKKESDGGIRTLELDQTTDILGELGREKQDHVLVGFALETNDVEENARKKLESKNLDMIVANMAGDGATPFGPGPSRVRIFTRDGEDCDWPQMSKKEVAALLLTFIRERFLP